MPQSTYSTAEVDQKLADVLGAARAADITPEQVQAAATAAVAKAIAALPAPVSGLTVAQVQKLIDDAIAKALVSLPRTYVGPTMPKDAPDGSLLLVPRNA